MGTINLKLLETYKSLPAGLEWNNIPNFAIITGKNGTGKSHLLELMNQINNWEGQPFSQQEIKYIPPMHNFIVNSNVTSSQYVEQNKQKYTQALGVFKSIQNFIENTDVKNILKESGFDLLKMSNLDIQNFKQQYGNNNEIVSIIGNLQNNKPVFSAILEKTQHKKIEDLTEEEFAEHFSIDPYNDFTTALHLKQWFTLYIDDYDKKSGAANRSKDHKTQKKLEDEKPPWVFMNKILKDCKFKYRIVDFDPNITPLEIKFTDGTDTVQIEGLSSGEQQIISLVAWAHHEIISENINLLLLDEPDAHLHPNFCEIFIKIMNEYVVEKHKIKVIMTTHSPSTIAYANEESIFVMNMPKDSNCTNRIVKQTKQEALRTLSDGLMILSDNSIVAIGEIFNSPNQHILLCEGKTDKMHIEQAKILDENLSMIFNDIKIVDVGGIGNMTVLIPVLKQIGRNSENTTVLFDGDVTDIKDLDLDKIRKDFPCILLPEKNIESMTKLYESNNSENFRKWILDTYPNMLDNIESTTMNYPSGISKLIVSYFDEFIKCKGKKTRGEIKNPLNNDNIEKTSNVFKNLWCEYLKHHEDESKEYYKHLVDFLVSNIK